MAFNEESIFTQSKFCFYFYGRCIKTFSVYIEELTR